MKSYLSVSQSTDKGNETDVKKQPLTQHGGRTSEHFLAILGESFARPCLCRSSLVKYCGRQLEGHMYVICYKCVCRFSVLQDMVI